MTRSLVALLAAAAAGTLPAAASASCYFVYSARNELVYRSTIAPVDLSRPISEGLRGRFAGGHMVMIPDETGCPDLLASGESQLFATLGFSNKGAGGRSAAAIDASPLFQNNAGARPGSDTVGAETPSDVVSPQRGRRSAPAAPASTVPAPAPASTAPPGR